MNLPGALSRGTMTRDTANICSHADGAGVPPGANASEDVSMDADASSMYTVLLVVTAESSTAPTSKTTKPGNLPVTKPTRQEIKNSNPEAFETRYASKGDLPYLYDYKINSDDDAVEEGGESEEGKEEGGGVEEESPSSAPEPKSTLKKSKSI